MKILVDTSVWSEVLRKPLNLQRSPITTKLKELIIYSQAAIIGVIRQEVLSGIKSLDQFKKLKTYLSPFPDVVLETNDFESGAELFNHCRSAGIQGSHIDFLIAATAINRKMPIFTLDQDFKHYAKYIPITLF